MLDQNSEDKPDVVLAVTCARCGEIVENGEVKIVVHVTEEIEMNKQVETISALEIATYHKQCSLFRDLPTDSGVFPANIDNKFGS